MEKKIFKYKDKEYVFKKINLHYAKNGMQLQRNIKKFAREFTVDSEMNMRKFEKNKLSPEYSYWKEQYEDDLKYANEIYMLDPANLKDVLKLLVDGDVDSIDVANLKDEELTEFFNFTSEVLGFFTPNNKVNNKKLKK